MSHAGECDLIYPREKVQPIEGYDRSNSRNHNTVGDQHTWELINSCFSASCSVLKDLPKTIADLVAEHQVLGLVNHMHTKLKGWPRSKKIPFLRRSYIYQKVQARAPHYISEPSSLIRAAQQMDLERNSLGKSVYQYCEYLKENDSNIHKRKRPFEHEKCVIVWYIIIVCI